MADTLNKVISVILKVVDQTGNVVKNTVSGLDQLKTKVEGVNTSLNTASRSFSSFTFRNSKDIIRDIEKVKSRFNDFKNTGNRSATAIETAYKQAKHEIKLLNQELKAGLAPMRNIVKSVFSLKTALAGMAAGYAIAKIVKDTADFDDAIKAAGATARATQEDMILLEKSARDMGENTRYSATEAARALQMLTMAGFNVQQATDALPNVLQLAASGMLDIGKAADITTNILTGYGLEVGELGRVNDVLVSTFTRTNTNLIQLGQGFTYVGPIAKSAGLQFEEVSALLGALANAGYKGSRAGVVLRTAISNLLAPTNTISRKIKELGLNVKNSDGSMVSLISIIDQLKKKGASTADVLTLFGKRSGPGMASLLSIGSEALEKLRTQLENSSGTAAEVADRMESGLGGTIRRLISGWQEYRINIGKAIEPEIITFLEQVTQSLKDTKSEITDIVAGFISFSLTILSAVVSIGTFLAENGKLILSIGALVAGLYTFGAALQAIQTINAVGFVGAFSTQIDKSLILFNSFKTTIVTGAVSIIGSLKSIGVALRLLASGNPVIFSLVAAVTAATVAYALFSKTSSEAAKEHQDFADSIGSSREHISKQIEGLELLKKEFEEAEVGSAKFVNAQEKLAKILPENEFYVDSQGKVLAKLPEGYNNASEALQSLIDKLKEQNKLLFTTQLEAQAKALFDSKKAIKEHIGELSSWYGIQEKGERSYDIFNKTLQGFWRSLNTITGSFDKAKAKTGELSKVNTEATSKYNALIAEAFKYGYTVEDLSKTLESSYASFEIKKYIIDSYKKLIAEQKKQEEESKKAILAALEAEQQAKSEADEREELAQALNEEKDAKKKLKIIDAELSKAHQEEKKVIRELKKELKELAGNYKYLSDSLADSAKSQITSIDIITKAKLDAAKDNLNESDYITRENQILAEGYSKKLEIIQEYTRASQELLDEEYQARSNADQENVGADVEQEILSKRKEAYSQTVSAYRSMIDSMISEEKRHTDAVKSSEDERANLRLSIEDKIRALRQKGLTDAQVYADKLKQIDEKQAAAKAALAEGDYERSKKLAEQAITIAEANQRTEGKDVSKKAAADSVNKSISEIKESESIINQVLDATTQKHQEAADAIKNQRENLESSLQEAQDKIQQINDKLVNIAEVKIQMSTDQINAADAKLDTIKQKLDDLDGKKIDTYLQIHEELIEAHSVGGIAGAARQFAKVVPSVYLRRASKLQGFGGGDLIPAHLERGEGILNKYAMAMLGEEWLNKANSLRLSKDSLSRLSQDSVVNNASTTTNSTSFIFDGINMVPRPEVTTHAQRLMNAVLGSKK